MSLKIGDIVRLKSGSPEMTVVGFRVAYNQQDVDKHECQWFDLTGVHSAWFPSAALEVQLNGS